MERKDLKRENIKVGTYKNWKALCQVLDIPNTGGNTKKAYLTDLAQYCRFKTKQDDSTIGNKIIIEEIYDKPKIKLVDKGRSIYQDDIQELILHLLYKQDNEIVTFSTGRLLKELYMVNQNYGQCRSIIPKLSAYLGIDEYYTYEFYLANHTKLKNKLETALKQLRSRALLTWTPVIILHKQNIKILKNEIGEPLLDDNNNVVTDIFYTYDIATEEEKKLIIKIEKEVLNNMGLKNKQQVFLSKKNNQFNQKVNKKLSKLANIDYYYNAYQITFNKEFIKDEIVTNKNVLMNDINKKIVNSTLKGAKTRHQNAISKMPGFGASLDKSINMKANEKFIDANKTLTYNLIDIKAQNIISEVRKTLSAKEKDRLDYEEALALFGGQDTVENIDNVPF